MIGWRPAGHRPMEEQPLDPGQVTERRRLFLRRAVGYAHYFAALFLLSLVASRGQSEQWLRLPWWAVLVSYYAIALGLGVLIGRLEPGRLTLPRAILLAGAIVFLILTLLLWHMGPSLPWIPRLKWALAGAVIMGAGYGWAFWFSARRR